MPNRKGEPDPELGAKAKGLRSKNQEWREHVSPGALRAYDVSLAPQREEAAALRRKGRLVAAHKREAASYKIRVRGHDRARRAAMTDEAAVEKNLRAKVARVLPNQSRSTEKTLRLGPFERTVRDVRVGPRSRGEEIAEVARAVGTGAGGVKLIAGLGVGAAGGGAAATAKERADNARERAKATAKRIAQKSEEKTEMKKSLVLKSAPSNTLVLSQQYDEDGLVDLYKGFWSEGLGKVKGAVKQATNDASGAWSTKLADKPGDYAGAGEAAFQSLKGSAAGKTAAYGALGGAALYGGKKAGQAAYSRVVAPRIAAGRETLKGYKKKAMWGAGGLVGTAVAAPAIGSYLGARSGG